MKFPRTVESYTVIRTVFTNDESYTKLSLNVKMEAKVHQELLCFLAKHSLEKIFSSIDDIVLSYLVSVVELINGSVDDDDVLDVVELMDMMNAYLPGFDKIGRSEVIDWMFGLTNKFMASSPGEHDKMTEDLPLVKDEHDVMADEKRFPIYDYSQKPSSRQAACASSICASDSDCADCTNHLDTNTTEDTKQDYGSSCEPSVFVSSSPCKDSPKFTSSHSLPKNQSLQTYSVIKGSRTDSSSQGHQDSSSKVITQQMCEENQVRILLEMFPASCSVEAHHCLKLSAGNMDHAAQLIMDRQDTGETFSEKATSRVGASDAGQGYLQRVNMTNKKEENSAVNAGCIKSCVLEKYSFIDTEEDKRTYRPPPPKKDAKKLVRYRDGQVVSTKGERFSAVEKKDESELKHTYVNLKPARKYRFH